MSCALCTVRERCKDSILQLLPDTADMGVLLTGILSEHNIGFVRQQNVVALKGVQDRSRVVALLRQVMSDCERQAVSVLPPSGSDYPVTKRLDEWWRIHETDWFRKALSEDQFETWFQPIVDTNEDNRAFAHECLIRLRMGRSYNGGEIVDAARTRNEIHLFDSYARRLAIRSAARQEIHGKYFVNFMPSSIYNPEFCMKTTLETLEATGMTPSNVVFEVVESDLVRDPAHLRRICDFYRRHGFAFALDDVGTGANSLQMVCDLQPNYIKLDKSLVQGIEQPMYAATIRKLVEFADQFGVNVIAEGVETAQTMENLWLLGVHLMQGYYFGRPAPALSAALEPVRELALV